MRRAVVSMCLVAAVVGHLAPPAAAAEPPPLPLASTVASFDGYINAASVALQAANPGTKLPFVGKDGIDQGTPFLGDVGSKLRGVLGSLPDARSMAPAALPAAVDAAAAAKARPYGLKITPDLRCGDAPCAPAALAKDVSRVVLTLDAGVGSPDGLNCSGAPCEAAKKVGGRPFEIGLPGLQFTSGDDSVTSTVSWHLRVTVGVDASGSFLSPGANTPEMRVGLDVVLPPTMEGTLGFVDVKTKVDGAIDGRGGFRGTFLLDTTGPDVRAGQAAPVTVALTAVADAVIRAEAGVNSAVPGIGADLRLHWGWKAPATPGATSDLSVSLDNVHLTTGTFLGKVVAPIVQGIHDVVAPIAPVAQILNEPIPGISDVFGDTTLVDLAGVVAGASNDLTIQSLQQLIAIATKLTLAFNAADSTEIKLGQAVLNNSDLLGAPGGQVHFPTDALQTIRDKCGPCAKAVDDAQGLIGTVIKGGPKLEFPLLDKPERLVGVLLGNDVDLVAFDSKLLHLENNFGGDLPSGSFAGYGFTFKDPTLNIDARVFLGYDTAGIRRVAAAGGAASIADGLWVDRSSFIKIKTPAQLELSANFGVVTLGIRGELTLDAEAKVRNAQPDVRVRPAGGRLPCIFELSGLIRADVGFFVSGPLGIAKTEITIADVTLADFKVLDAANCANPDAKPPVLGHVEGTILVLNVGNSRKLRGPDFEGATTDDEKSRVTSERRQTNGTQMIRVDVQGYTQFFPSTAAKPITQIHVGAETHKGTESLITATDDGRPFDLIVSVRGAQGGNTVNARTDASHPVIFFDSPGPNKVTTGDANDTVFGGGGDDIIKLGKGNDIGIGGPGNDVIDGGPGMDTLLGQEGDDTLIAGNDASPNLLVGGAGNDQLSGGPGPDQLFGDECGASFTSACDPGYGLQPDAAGLPGGGDDLITGGGGNDTMVGGAGADRLFSASVPASGGAPAQKVTAYGGAGADLFVGGPGPDTFYGGPDNDHALGGGDSDLLVGGDGDDVLGGALTTGTPIGEGTLFRSAPLGTALQADILRGGPGNDNLTGSAGPDLIEGGPGSDILVGGEGDDLLIGGSQAPGTPDDGDIASGGPGNDILIGDNGDRVGGVARLYDVAGTVIGAADDLSGDAGSDIVLGGPGDDILRGGDGDDRLEGGAGSDSISGGDGQDDILGGSSPLYLAGVATAAVGDSGDRLLSGGPGHDVILGDNGSITRGPVVADDPEAPDRISRTVRFLDSGPSGTIVGGGDRIDGGPGHDLLFGQVGDDIIAGGDGNDAIEGNQGSDVLDGGAGEDDVVGGTTPTALPSGLTTAQFPDAGDTVAGGDGNDLLVGDNAIIGHVVGADGTWARSPADGRYLRTLTLADRTTIGGPDVLLGGAGNDDAFGGLGDDRIHGGPGQDYLEGNQGADVIDGSSGDDDIVGGTSPIGLGGDERAAGSTPDGADIIHGRAPDEPAQIPPSGLAIGIDTVLDGDGLSLTLSIRYGPIPEPAPGTEPDGDVVAGDNARIDRCRPSGFLVRQWMGRLGCTWSTGSVGFYGPTTNRWVQQLGQPLHGLGILNEIIPDNHSGNDVVYGDDGDDLLLGEGGFDTMHGGAGDDILYGGIGPFNQLYGDGGGIDVVVTPPDLSLLAVLGVF